MNTDVRSLLVTSLGLVAVGSGGNGGCELLSSLIVVNELFFVGHGDFMWTARRKGKVEKRVRLRSQETEEESGARKRMQRMIVVSLTLCFVSEITHRVNGVKGLKRERGMEEKRTEGWTKLAVQSGSYGRE